MAFGIGIAVRDFDCDLCQQSFTLCTGDLIVSEIDLCDQCLADLWLLEGEDLRQHISQQLARNASPSEGGSAGDGEQSELEDRIVQWIQRYKQQGVDINQHLQNREAGRRSFD